MHRNYHGGMPHIITNLVQGEDFDGQFDNDPEDCTRASNTLEQLVRGINELAFVVHQFGSDDLVHAQAVKMCERPVATVDTPTDISNGPDSATA